MPRSPKWWLAEPEWDLAMSSKVLSAALVGAEAIPVEVEAQLSASLPNFVIVGLPDTAVSEARERVRAALGSAGLPFPQRRVTVNLAPADVRKEGSGFDLAVAVAVAAAVIILAAPGPTDEVQA